MQEALENLLERQAAAMKRQDLSLEKTGITLIVRRGS
jgi:hypothetical protein